MRISSHLLPEFFQAVGNVLQVRGDREKMPID